MANGASRAASWVFASLPGVGQVCAGCLIIGGGDWLVADGIASAGPLICGLGFMHFLLGLRAVSGQVPRRRGFVTLSLLAAAGWIVAGGVVVAVGRRFDGMALLCWVTAAVCLLGLVGMAAPAGTAPAGATGPKRMGASGQEAVARLPRLDLARLRILRGEHRYAAILGLSPSDDVPTATDRYMAYKARYPQASHQEVSAILDDAYGHVNTPDKRRGCALCDRMAGRVIPDITKFLSRHNPASTLRTEAAARIQEEVWSGCWQAVVTHNGHMGQKSLEQAVEDRYRQMLVRYQQQIGKGS